ncbi:MAG: histidinol-phosphate transaminase [Desulfurella sp.]|uniref:histidinol-phosphate transaminase n=1 Tax=Desulfurella sp. TaxID=1962857 RepID=UPI000CAA3428|nr:histidinol-phosphate transaminase [Desulfurella sp.]PMP92790.1 MAG: histidinol-phosphate transaminase [Desulfurella sp.]HEX13399.1 histidinol-phosphate transaminase [Desulfurella acetivorans]
MKVADYLLKITPYEGGKPIEELQRELGLVDVIKLASNENPLGPSKKVIETICKIAVNVNLYPDGNAYYLTQKLAKHLGVSEKNLIFGNGSDEIIELLYKAFATNQNDEILYCYPTFIEYRIIGMAFNKKIIELPLKDFAYDIDNLIEHINENTRIIFINTPNNPTGTLTGLDDILKIINKASKDTLIVIDEAYYEYAKPSTHYKELLDLYKKENVIILRTFSKAYALAGLRIGYGIANEFIIQTLNRVRPPFNVNIVAQAAAIAALDDKEHLKKSIQTNEEGKQFLYEQFNKLNLFYVPTFANFILFSTPIDASIVYENLLKEGVIVRSMKPYGYNNFLRVTVGTQKENEIFIQKLKKVLHV